MSEILEGNYKMNKFPIGSVIKSRIAERLVSDFITTEEGIGLYELEIISVGGVKSIGVGRFYFTQEYIESFYHLKEGEENEN